MGRGKFYSEWFRRAVSGKIGKAQAASGLGAIITAAAIWAAKQYPAMNDWIPFTVDQTMVVIFALVFLAMLVLGFILAPYDMHVEDVRLAENLTCRLNQQESSAEPCLSFAKSLSPSERYPRPTDARLHRIAIQNTSETRALHNVEVSISVSQSDGSSKTTARPVKDSDGQSAWDLNPGGAKQIDLLATKPDKRPPRVYFAPYFPGLSPRSANDGTYNVLLEATCRETRKVEGQFTLTLTGNGELHWQEVA